MAHGPATEWEKQKSEGYKSRLGLYMFGAYTLLYVAFILIAVLKPKLLGMDVLQLNLAVFYGFALIVIAIIQALVYNYLCNKREKLDKVPGKSKGEVD